MRQRRDVRDRVHGGRRHAEDQRGGGRNEHALRHRKDEHVQQRDGRGVHSEVDDAPRHRIESEEVELAVVDGHGERPPVGRHVAEQRDVGHVRRERARIDVAEDEEVVAVEVVAHRRDVDPDDECDDAGEWDVSQRCVEDFAQSAAFGALIERNVRDCDSHLEVASGFFKPTRRAGHRGEGSSGHRLGQCRTTRS